MELFSWKLTLLVLLGAGIFGYISVKIREPNFLALSIFSAAICWIPFIQFLVFVLYVCAGLVYGSYFGARYIMKKMMK